MLSTVELYTFMTASKEGLDLKALLFKFTGEVRDLGIYNNIAIATPTEILEYSLCCINIPIISPSVL